MYTVVKLQTQNQISSWYELYKNNSYTGTFLVGDIKDNKSLTNQQLVDEMLIELKNREVYQ
jgi:hypothetical protein